MGNAMLLLWISLGLTAMFFLAIVGMWVYSYSRSRADNKKNNALEAMVSIAVLPDKDKRQDGIEKLQRYVHKNGVKKELLIKLLIGRAEARPEANRDAILYIVKQTGIDRYLDKMLQSKSGYNQSLACRYAGDLRIASVQESIRKLMQSHNNDVIYNVLLALAKLADLEGLSESLRANSSTINLSFRAIVEVITAFTGSKEQLIKETIDYCDDYMKGILIKAAADNRCSGLTKTYIGHLNSANKNLRIACIRAISETKDPLNEPYMIAMLEDKEWEVRAAAAKSLEQVGTHRSLESLGETVRDREWWVRQNAAITLISLPGGKEYAKDIINGKDKYASEAIVGVLELSAT